MGSEHQFTTKYAAYVDKMKMDAADVRTANANIVNTAPPPVALKEETGMHRWYHDVDAAVQANAKAIMGKELVKAEAAAGAHPTASCLTDLKAAMAPALVFADMYENYNKILGDSTLDAGDTKQIKARACVKALSGAEKELAIQVGLRAPPSADKKKGALAQPMYSMADAALRGEMMNEMV